MLLAYDKKATKNLEIQTDKTKKVKKLFPVEIGRTVRGFRY